MAFFKQIFLNFNDKPSIISPLLSAKASESLCAQSLLFALGSDAGGSFPVDLCLFLSCHRAHP